MYSNLRAEWLKCTKIVEHLLLSFNHLIDRPHLAHTAFSCLV